jgi:hypothetical protein
MLQNQLFYGALASILSVECLAQSPAAIYDGGYGNDSAIGLRIGNGGAGQSGLVRGQFAESTT